MVCVSYMLSYVEQAVNGHFVAVLRWGDLVNATNLMYTEAGPANAGSGGGDISRHS
jgi:hypothetical protein